MVSEVLRSHTGKSEDTN